MKIDSKRRRGALLAVLGAGLLTLPAAGPVSAQTVPVQTETPTGSVVVLAGQGDVDTYVPAPVRTAGPDAPPPPPTATTQITYLAGFPEEAKAALEAAINVWAGLITSSQPITVQAQYVSLGEGRLGQAITSFHENFTNAPMANTWYARPLAEALSNSQLGSDPDITMKINVRSDWYFGTDGNTPSLKFDLMSLVMHEMLHGLGMLGTMTVDAGTGQGSWGLGSPLHPAAFDRFTQNNGFTYLLNTSTYPNPSVALGNVLQGGQVFFNSPQTNRGQSDRPRLYAPNPWQPGASYQHFDEGTYTPGSSNAMPTPLLNSSEANHNPGPLALCMLEAMGWSTVENCVPPASTQVGGFTWFSTGGFAGTGPNGTTIRAYATGASPGKTYKLVSGMDGGPEKPCMWDTVALNAANRVASSTGVIGTTGGVLNRGPGNWQICFREEGSGNTLLVSSPASFQIT